jgi:L-rhamnose isomerase
MSYKQAVKKYADFEVDVGAALEKLASIPISMHCWQGDDVGGFENAGALTGGIQTTGNYPGKARTPEELMADIDMALSLIPGKHRINLHACYAVFKDGKKVDRDKLKPEHFKAWVDFAKKRGLGIDFNPTYFSHPLGGQLTLSHPDKEIRDFWIRHTICCIRIAEYFAKELKSPCTLNIWVQDGLKDVPADRMGPRLRLKNSLDRILKTKYNRKAVNITVESKLFGIGAESYTVGSHEFYMNYAAKNNLLCLLDSGHFHLSENVADKISSLLLFAPKVAFHVSRPVRWDSDHVIRLDDMLRDIASEIVKLGPENFIIALDYFDASINRIAAWVLGMRNMQKAMLEALLMPHDLLATLQDEGLFTEILILQEEYKTMPFGEIWDEFCRRNGVPEGDSYFADILEYEDAVLSQR